VQLTHLVGHVIDRLAGVEREVRWLHPGRLIVGAGLFRGREPGGKTGELALQHHDVGLSKVIADHAKGQVPAGYGGSIRPHQDGLKWLHSAYHWTVRSGPLKAAARRTSSSGPGPDQADIGVR